MRGAGTLDVMKPSNTTEHMENVRPFALPLRNTPQWNEFLSEKFKVNKEKYKHGVNPVIADDFAHAVKKWAVRRTDSELNGTPRDARVETFVDSNTPTDVTELMEVAARQVEAGERPYIIGYHSPQDQHYKPKDITADFLANQWNKTTFKNGRFTECDFAYSQFFDCTFRNIEFIDCSAHGALFQGVTFENLALHGLDLNGVTWSCCTCRNVNFTAVPPVQIQNLHISGKLTISSDCIVPKEVRAILSKKGATFEDEVNKAATPIEVNHQGDVVIKSSRIDRSSPLTTIEPAEHRRGRAVSSGVCPFVPKPDEEMDTLIESSGATNVARIEEQRRNEQASSAHDRSA